jgi:hypothetical protein
MDRGRVGDERGSKEMDRCPLTARDKGEDKYSYECVGREL